MEKVDRFEKHRWRMWSRVVSVYDGDTITLLCYVRGQQVRWRTRLMGFDAPEMKSRDPGEKEKAKAAKCFLQTMLPKYPFRVTVFGVDKYGRLLVDLKYKGRKISDIMIENNHAYAYNGGTKRQNPA